MQRDTIDFEREKVPTLFRKLLLPTLSGSLAISAVTVIDGIFVGQGTGANGVAAVNIVVPIYQIMAGIGLMVGAGCSVAASIFLSRRNYKAARLHATQAIVLTSLAVLLFAIAVMCFPAPAGRLLGASPTLLPLVTDYLLWIMSAFVFQMWSMIGLFIIRLDGSPKYAMWCSILPAALNAVLDWLFIFPLDMGVKGAAIATNISISVGGMMAMAYLLKGATTLGLVPLKLSSKSLRLALRNILYQCKIGSSTLMGELTLAVLFYAGNLTFMRYLGDAGVGAFGIACYYMPFFFMVGNAIAQSAQPIISYNYGAARLKEMKEARRLLLGTSFAIGLAVALLFFFLPDRLVALFVDTHSRAGILAIEGFPYLALGIVFFITNVAVIGYYQSVECIGRANLIVMLRGFGLLVPCFVLLPLLWGACGIWLAMPLTEAVTSLIVLWMYLSKRQRTAV